MSSIWRLSRPRFWMYLAGPYTVGFVASNTALAQGWSWQFWLGFFIWLIPANLLLYGVNDLADADTDQFNTKKTHQESYIAADHLQYRRVITSLMIAMASLLLLWSLTTSIWIVGLTLLFIFLSVGYSVAPLRFKARPGWDSYSNVLYILPGIIGYAQTQAPDFPLNSNVGLAILAGAAFSVGMHAFSAIPDIKPDTKAGLATIATRLGAKATLWFCLCHWLLMIVIGGYLIGPWAVFGIPYLFIPAWLLTQPTAKIEEVYWWFPYLNTGLGAGLFFLTLWTRWSTEILGLL